jgi:hypothetical protein
MTPEAHAIGRAATGELSLEDLVAMLPDYSMEKLRRKFIGHGSPDESERERRDTVFGTFWLGMACAATGRGFR